MSVKNDTVKVWDPLVRIGHWVLVAAFFTAYFTEEELLTQHTWAGYLVAGVVLVRIAWGFIGSEHARFGDFVRSPGETLRYLREIATNKAKRFIGHNPAGGAMVVALLLSLIATTWSGLEIYAIEEDAGPLAGLYGDAATGPQLPSLVASAHASGDDRENELERAEEFWEEVHEVAANLTLLLVLLHVAGVVVASVSHRENLVKAMVSGRKDRGTGD
jgi:cytochrome b